MTKLVGMGGVEIIFPWEIKSDEELYEAAEHVAKGLLKLRENVNLLVHAAS